jgi:hypothetical protein
MNNRTHLYTISYQKHHAAIGQKQGRHAFHGDFSEIVLPISSDVLPIDLLQGTLLEWSY